MSNTRGIPTYIIVNQLLEDAQQKINAKKREAEEEAARLNAAAEAAKAAAEQPEMKEQEEQTKGEAESKDSEPSQSQAADDSQPASSSSGANCPTGCQGEACKRKPTEGCTHGMCFDCCFTSGRKDVCSIHYAKAVKRQREDKYIEEGLSTNKGPKRLPLLAESRFTAVGQTVVLWSLYDFCVNKRWSEDTFNQQLRQQRQRDLLKKRQRLSEAALTSGSD